MSEIRVDPQFLVNLSARIDGIATSLDGYTRHGACDLSSAPTVAGAYAKLGKRWDHNRGKLVKELRALADAINASRQALVEADSSSAKLLTESQ